MNLSPEVRDFVKLTLAVWLGGDLALLIYEATHHFKFIH